MLALVVYFFKKNRDIAQLKLYLLNAYNFKHVRRKIIL